MPSSRKHISILAIGLALLDIILAGFAGWLVIDQLRSTDRHQVTTSCALSDPQLCSFFAKVNTYRYDRYQVITKIGDGTGSEELVFIRVDGADKKHVASLGVISYDETLYAGTTAYSRDPTDNTWWKQPHPLTSNEWRPLTMPSQKVAARYTYLGIKSCGEYKCRGYHVADDKANKLTNTDLWFDTSQYKIRKMRSVEPSATTVLVFTYDNQPIEIPTNTKPRDEFDIVLPSYGTAIMPSAGVPSRAEMTAVLEQYDE
jgi:hypothetical protein